MLHRLPVEILLNVAPFLDIDDEDDGVDSRVRTNHDNLRQCSRHLYEVFTPLRFRDIRIRMTNVFSADGFWPQPPEGLPVVYFTKLLILKPHFAGFVRSLELHPYPGPGPEFRFSPIEPAPSRAEFERIVQPVSCSSPDSQKWLDDLLDGNEDAFIALLLVQLKNLDTLELDFPEVDRCPHLTRVIQRAAEPKACGYFSNLKTVSLHKGPTWEDYSLPEERMALSRLLPFFHLPSIRSIRSARISTRAFPKALVNAGFLGRKSSLAKIHLDGMSGVPPNLPDIISLCPRLESFEYGLDARFDGNHDPFDPALFYSPLKNSISTLKTLSMEIVPYNTPHIFQTPEYYHRQFFGPLSDFSALENVRMTMCNLIPFCEHSWALATPLPDMLPTSLRVFYITHAHAEVLPYLVDSLSEILRHRSSHFPRLKRLVIHLVDLYDRGSFGHWTKWYLEMPDVPQRIKDGVAGVSPKVSELEKAFKDVGAEFAVVTSSKYDQLDFP